MNSYDVITIGSASQDTYIVSSRIKIKKGEACFPLGTKIELSSMRMEVGGGATNAAATFARFGFSVGVFAHCGDDPSGEFVLNELQKMKIDIKHISIIAGEQTAYAVIYLTTKGERTVFVYRGVSADCALTAQKLSKVDAKWLYLTSVAGNTTTLKNVFAKTTDGVNIAWNPGKAEIRKGLAPLRPFLKKSSVVFLNSEEARLLFGPHKTQKEFLQKIRKVTSAVVVVTQGEHGSHAFVGNTVFHARPQVVKPADTTGAGDAFGSGFIAGMMKKPGDFSYALTAGSANAMSVVKEVGAKHGLAPVRQIKKLQKHITITKQHASI